MRSINLYSDLECTNLVSTIVTQDYVLPEDKNLYTCITSYGGTLTDAWSWTVDQLPDPVVYTTRWVAEGESPSEQTESFMPNPSIASTTVAFPLGEPGNEPEIKNYYVEGGIRLDWDYYYNQENDSINIALWAPKYFSGWSEPEDPEDEPEPQFESIWIKTEQGSNVLWVNRLNTQSEATYLTINNASEYSDIQLIFVEGDVFYKKLTTPQIGRFDHSFIPVVLATHNGDLECINGYPNGYPSAISSNCLTSEEVIPDPPSEETNEGNNVLQDGQGAGIGVSDDAADIDASLLNRSSLSWGGTGNGLSYYHMHVSTFLGVIRQLWHDIFASPEEAIRNIVGTFILNQDNPYAYMDFESIRQCLLGAFIVPYWYQEVVTANDTCWVGPYGAYAPGATYIVSRYQEIFNNRLSHTRPSFAEDGFGDFSDFNNCTASLHLPFVGDISIDIATVARGDIRVKAIIDNYNGNISYLVYTRSMQAPLGKEILYGVYTGNCAVMIPITAIGSNPEIFSRIMNAGSGIASGVLGALSGNVAQIPGILQSGYELQRAANDMSVVNRGGAIDTNSGPLQTLDITLQIRRGRELKPEHRREIEGNESITTAKIREFEGFLKVRSCDLKGLKCDERESERIRALLMEGVYV